MRCLLSLFLLLTCLSGVAQDAVTPSAPPVVPPAADALAAFASFSADPLKRLDATQPFLDFIRSSGAVHIVLNEALLGWMYSDLDPHNKAVLYAAFLGGNMAGQLEGGSNCNDNVAAMTSALAAYRAIQAEQPAFSLPLFEQLAGAAADGTFESTVQAIANDTPSP